MNRLRTKNFLFCLSLLFFCLIHDKNTSAQAKRPIIRRIDVVGSNQVRREIVLEQLNLKPDALLPPTWPDGSLERLIQWYHTQGYYNIKIDSLSTTYSLDSSRVDLFVGIHEGEQVRIGRIDLIGLGKEDQKSTERLMNTQINQVFNALQFEQDMEEILTYWEDRGHPLCQIEIEKLSIEHENGTPRLGIVLSVDKGRPVYIDGLSVRGNRLTQSKVILRETRLKLGSLYRHREIRSAKENLQRLGYFRKVLEPDVSFVQDRAFVIFHVEEGNTNSIDGVVGYHPPPSEEKPGYWTGRLQFDFRNLLGTGRLLDVYWEKKDAYSQAMHFGYEEPWLFGYPLHIGGRFEQEIRDTTYIERDWGISVRYAPWASLSLGIKGGQRSVLPDSLGSVLYGLARTTTWRVTFSIQYNTMDDPWNPRKGVQYYTAFTLGRKENIGPDFIVLQEGWKRHVDTRQVQVDAETALPIFGRQVFYLGLHGTEIKTGDEYVPISDQVRFGGARSLRGYGEDMFRGELVAWFNSEFRHLLGRRSRAFLFIDAGMYQRKEKEAGRIDGTKIGYGFGIRIETRLGLFGVDYGLGEGDSFLRGKVHVGLVNWF